MSNTGMYYEPDGLYAGLASLLAQEKIRLVGGDLNALDRYDALVLSATSVYEQQLKPSEIQQVMNFVNAGGGLVILGEYEGFRNYLRSLTEQLGVRLAQTSEIEAITSLSDVPIFEGVSAVRFMGGGGIDLAANSPLEAVGWGEGRALAAQGWYGQGRVVVIGDSNLFDSRRLNENIRFAVNVFRWVCGMMD